MPHLRHLSARRLLGATPTLLIATGLATPMAAEATAIELRSSGHEALLCRVECTNRRGGHFVAYPGWRWVLSLGETRYELGWLYAAQDGDSPQFHSLTLRCVRRDRMILGETPSADEASYSLELQRLDPVWVVPILGPWPWTRQLPRNGTVVSFLLGATGLPREPLRILQMSISEDWIQPHWELNYDLGDHDYRLAADAMDDSGF